MDLLAQPAAVAKVHAANAAMSLLQVLSNTGFSAPLPGMGVLPGMGGLPGAPGMGTIPGMAGMSGKQRCPHSMRGPPQLRQKVTERLPS